MMLCINTFSCLCLGWIAVSLSDRGKTQQNLCASAKKDIDHYEKIKEKEMTTGVQFSQGHCMVLLAKA
jgi:hypothetical protein